MIGNCSPIPLKEFKETEAVPHLDIGEPQISTVVKPANVINITPPLSSFHYQVKKVSVFRSLSPLHNHSCLSSHGDFLTTNNRSIKSSALSYILLLGCVSLIVRVLFPLNDSVMQEDPFEDMKVLELTSEDSMLVITSAGDNALHYAISAQPKRVSLLRYLSVIPVADRYS